jgi:uncharacterized membrane protein
VEAEVNSKNAAKRTATGREFLGMSKHIDADLEDFVSAEGRPRTLWQFMSPGRQISPVGRRMAAMIGLLLILLVALGFRIFGISHATLWTDELFSLQSSAGLGFQVENVPRMTVLDPAPRPTSLQPAGSIWAIYSTQAADTHPPLYFMLLRLWRDGTALLPWSPESVCRVPSVVASLATVTLLYLCALTATASRSAAALTGLLTALATSQIAFAQEVRGYALAVMFLSVAALLLFRIERDGWTPFRAGLLGTSAVLAVCTLYLATLPLVAMGLYAALHLRGRPRSRTLLTGLAAAVVSAALLGPLLVQQFQHLGQRNAWLISETPRTLPTVAADAAVAILGQTSPVGDSQRPVAIAIGILLCLFAVPLYRAFPPARLWLLWIAAVLLTLGVWDLASDKTHLQLPRYTFLASPAVLALIGSLAAFGKQLTATAAGVRLVPYAAVLLCGLFAPSAYESTAKEPWFLLRQYAEQGYSRPEDLIIVAGHSDRRWEHILYLGLSHYLPQGYPAQRFAAVISSADADDLTPFRAEAVRRGGIVLFAEYDTNATAAIPPGWVRTGLTNVPSLGTLQTFRPPTATTPATLPAD